jgi:hypothetical protein
MLSFYFPGPFLARLLLAHGQCVRTAQQRYGPLDIRLCAQEQADPAAFRQDMMRLSFACRHNLVPDFRRKGDVYQPIAMDMAYLTGSQAKLTAAKTVRVGSHPGPLQDSLLDLISSTTHSHAILPKADYNRIYKGL